MKRTRSLAIGLLVLMLGLAALHQGALRADAATIGSTTAPAAPRSGELIDANSVFFGCAAGVTVGALFTALPPLVGWTFYAGALPAVVAMVAASGVGCTVGLFGGVILSTVHWMTATIGAAFGFSVLLTVSP